MRIRSLQSSALILWLVIAVSSAEPEVGSERLPRIPPKSPQEALESFQIKEGFKVELVASEPLTTDPVAISFDRHRRLFTCEMRGYSERREDAMGRVRLLTDDDGDGVYDRATTYAEGLKWPTAMICWDDGVFVGATPDIWWFKDTDGDGIADEKKVVFTGFAEGSKRLNVQGLINSFVWGPDWRIHGSSSTSGGQISRPDATDQPAVNLRGYNFSFDPRKFDLRQEAGSAQYGMAFDDAGQRFVCSNSSHIEAVMYSWPWLDLDLPNPRVAIAVDGGSAEVYRTSSVEPWRVVRTQWRVQGLVGGPVEGGGRDSGYFTSASGLGIYRGDALPAEFRGNEFVGDVGSNLVHRKIIRRDSNRLKMVAERPADEQKVEFLTSTDNWFRPVMSTNGPDGALYIVDMYRETIEHPWSIPETIKQHLDLNSGNDRGRIWRVLPKGIESVMNRKILLRSANAWTREMAAQRMLAQWNTKGLNRMVEDLSAPAESRFAALYGLFAQKQLTKPLLERALADPEAIVRRHAVRLANQIQVDAGKLTALASDLDPGVRFELALLLTVTECYSSKDIAVDVLVNLAMSSPNDRWLGAAVAEAARKRGEVARMIGRLWRRNPKAPVLVTLAERVPGDHVEAVLKNVAKAEALGDAVTVLKALPALGGRSVVIQPLIERAKSEVSSSAIWLLGLESGESAGYFWDLMPKHPDLASAIVASLVKRNNWEAGMATHWAGLPAAARDLILTKLSAAALLDAVESGTIQATEISFRKRAGLRDHSRGEIKERALALLGKPDERSRAEVAEHYRGALRLQGDHVAGKTIFQQRCVTCHELPGSKEINAGPELRSFVNKGAAALLEHLISPNLEVAPQYTMWQVEMRDETTHVGLLSRETADTVTLQLPARQTLTLRRREVKSLTNLNSSLMPVGLEAGLSLQEMANLLTFVRNPET